MTCGKHTLLGFIGLGLMVAVVPAPVFAREEARVRLGLQALSMADEDVPGIFWKDGEEMKPLEIPATSLPHRVEYRGPNPMTLYARSENAEEGGNPYRVVASVQLPLDTRDVILLCRRTGNGLGVLPVPIREERFPDGGYMMFNLTPRSIVVAMGDEMQRVPANGAAMVPGPGEARSPVSVVFRYEDDTENLSLVSTTWFYNPRHRKFVFFAADGEEQGRMRVRSVTRFPTE